MLRLFFEAADPLSGKLKFNLASIAVARKNSHFDEEYDHKKKIDYFWLENIKLCYIGYVFWCFNIFVNP